MDFLNKIWYKCNHSVIMIIIVIVACTIGTEWYALLFMSGFWLGREHSQAEYRYMDKHNINRSNLK